MTFELEPLLDTGASLDALTAGLLPHIRASGLALPEDECLLDYVAAAVRFGHADALLAVTDGQAVGVTAWRTERGINYVTLLFVLPEAPSAAAQALLSAVMQRLHVRENGSDVFIEIPEVSPPVAEALREQGFAGAERLIMQADLSARRWAMHVPGGYRFSPWHDDMLDAAAAIIYQANIGTLDAQIIPELRSQELTAWIVRQTMGGRYGHFDRTASGLIVTDEGQPVAVTLATRRHIGQGFTAEICVLPQHRRHGLARALMQHTHAAFRAAGLTHGMLGVTAGNPAHTLYETLGYRTIGSVWTYVWPGFGS